MGIEYRLEFIPGKRRPGVDECDQGWERIRKEPGIDYSNLARVVNEAAELDAAWDGNYTHRVVEIEVSYVDQWDGVAGCWRKIEAELSEARMVA